MAGDLALVVGVDRYPDSPLNSCVNDARAIGSLLERDATDGDPRHYDVRLIVGEGPEVEDLTRDGLRAHLALAVDKAAARDFVFYFSGHGRRTSYGPEIVTQDLSGIGMEEVIGLIERSKVKQAIIILDCCFSGGFGNSLLLQGAASGSVWAGFERAIVRENFAILAASGAEEGASAGDELSPFTELIVEGLNGAAADVVGEIHAPALFEYAAPVFKADEQGPVFKGHYNSLSPLRKVPPEAPLGVVRTLKSIFPTGTDEIRLDPEDAQGEETEGQKRYAKLRKLRRYGVVDVVGEDRDLAELAAASGSVRLTPRGIRYRRLVIADRV